MRTLNRGYCLIELMVAMVISTAALIALTELYSSTRQTYRLQAMQSRLSEDGRFAVSMLQRLISQAGYRPSSDNLPTRISASRDLLTIITSTTIAFTGDGTSTMTCDGTLVGGVKTISIFRPDGSTDLLPLTSLRCKDGINETDWIVASVGGNGTELADFRIGYGMDSAAAQAGNTSLSNYKCNNTATQDCVADRYIYTTPVGDGNIVSLKLCFILRSEAADSSVTKSSNVTSCDGTNNVAGSQDDHKLYRTFNTTVLLKNR